MPLGEVMLDLQGLQLAADEVSLLTHPHSGAVILFDRNYQSPAQLIELITAIREHRPDMLIAVDQEGGRVQRFRTGFTRLPALARFGALYDRDAEAALQLAEQGAWLMAAELRACGVDFSFAPVLDLGLSISQVIGRRGFAAEPDTVAALGRAYISGMQRAGMAATGKHFPGHGSVAADSHVHLPVDERSLDSLREQDLSAFQQCVKQLDAIMPAHVLYPQVDSLPAGFSARWLQDILRQELGFTGVIFSDDLTMGAASASGSIEERTALALQSGCDMVLVCNNPALARRTLEYLDRINSKPASRLAVMRGRECLTRNELLQSDAWQQAVAAMAKLTHDGAE